MLTWPVVGAAVKTLFAERALEVVYHNADQLDYGSYEVKAVRIDEQPATVELRGDVALLPKAVLLSLPPDGLHRIDVALGSH